jgi:hypothetical protein
VVRARVRDFRPKENYISKERRTGRAGSKRGGWAEKWGKRKKMERMGRWTIPGLKCKAVGKAEENEIGATSGNSE